MRPLKGVGIKIDVWENPVVYASTREWSSLYLKVVKRLLSLPARTSERLWENSCCLSSACIVVGAVTVTPAENFVSPLSESSPPRKHFFFKKKSQCRRTTAWQFIRIEANVRQPFQVPLDSAFDRLKMNSSRPSAGYHSR